MDLDAAQLEVATLDERSDCAASRIRAAMR
jgi:hypothetical protein